MTASTTAGTSTRYDAIVIGGGINGLTCATRWHETASGPCWLSSAPSLADAPRKVRSRRLQRADAGTCDRSVRSDVVEELQLYLHGLTFSDSAIQGERLVARWAAAGDLRGPDAHS
jgi:hypothetical protein